MTIAFDAVTTNATPGDVTIPHTPVGTPRGVIVLMGQNTATDFIASVTYGGVAMTEVSGSPLLGTAGDEDQTMYGYFLGASIPTGVQNCVIDATSTPAKATVIITVTAAADTEVDATATLDSVTADPSLTLATTASTNTFVAAALGSGNNSSLDVTPDAAYTQLYEQVLVTNTQLYNFVRKTANPTGGNVTVNWTATIEDAHILAVAIRELGGAPSSSVDPFGTSGFFGG